MDETLLNRGIADKEDTILPKGRDPREKRPQNSGKQSLANQGLKQNRAIEATQTNAPTSVKQPWTLAYMNS